MNNEPLAVMDSQDFAQDTSALQHRLEWLRAEDIDPDTTLRVEVYLDDDHLYAEVTSFGHDDRAYTFTADGERVISKRRQDVSSAPPAEAAANTLAARVTGNP